MKVIHLLLLSVVPVFGLVAVYVMPRQAADATRSMAAGKPMAPTARPSVLASVRRGAIVPRAQMTSGALDDQRQPPRESDTPHSPRPDAGFVLNPNISELRRMDWFGPPRPTIEFPDGGPIMVNGEPADPEVQGMFGVKSKTQP